MSRIVIIIEKGDDHLVNYLHSTLAPRLAGHEACISLGSLEKTPRDAVPFPAPVEPHREATIRPDAPRPQVPALKSTA